MSDQLQASLLLKDTEQAQKFKSHSNHGSAFLKTVLEPVTEAYQEVLTVRRGRTPLYVSALKALDPAVVALTVLTVCLDSLSEPIGKLTLATRVAQYLNHELNYQTLEAANPGLIKRIHNAVKSHRARQRIDDAIKGGSFGTGIEEKLIKWDIDTKHHVGLALLEVLVSIGFLEVTRTGSSRVDKYQWSLSVTSWALDTYDSMLYYSPAYLPLTDKPQGYTEDGVENSYGPHFPPVEFRMKANKSSEKEPKGLANGINIEAADVLGSAPYQVNGPVMDVVKAMWDLGLEVGKLPSKDPLPLPTYPALNADETAIKEWKSKASKIHITNAHTHGLRLYTYRQLSIIDSFRDKPLYFLWRADSRGRLYPVATTILNPQGHDLSKGLLKFHDSMAKPLGQIGLKHLLRALSEHEGIDKVSLADRESHARSQWDTHIAVARDPIGNRQLWMYTDSPFQYLAACMELLAASEWASKNDKRITEYPSSYIKYHDGKCSGVQHWSALLRNKETAKAVALTECTIHDVPPDVYSEILMDLLGVVQGLRDSQPEAAWWAELIDQGVLDRKLVKPPTMTYVYGSTSRAWTTAIYNWAVDQGLKDYIEETSDCEEGAGKALFARCVWLSNKIGKALERRLNAVSEGMKWLKECSKAMTKAGSRVISWETPGGFRVRQAYRKPDTSLTEVKVNSLNIRVRLTKQYLTDEVDKKKQAGALAPNYIHSMDSTHLCDTVLTFTGPITTIHDSFGARLCDGDLLKLAIKSTFFHLYSEDWLRNLKGQWSIQYPDVQFPELPEYGDWSSDEVINSAYAFS